VTRRPARSWTLEHGALRDTASAREEFGEYLRANADMAASDYDGSLVIFGELVSNAVEHGNGGVSVGLYRDGNDAVLRVADEGPGFERAATTPHPRDARGRGLFFVRALARKVTIAVGTSTVEVVLPVSLLQATG
jgi:anti-sigma regulatory factor (Ser/Thr protein kinase)